MCLDMCLDISPCPPHDVFFIMSSCVGSECRDTSCEGHGESRHIMWNAWRIGHIMWRIGRSECRFSRIGIPILHIMCLDHVEDRNADCVHTCVSRTVCVCHELCSPHHVSRSCGGSECRFWRIGIMCLDMIETHDVENSRHRFRRIGIPILHMMCLDMCLDMSTMSRHICVCGIDVCTHVCHELCV